MQQMVVELNSVKEKKRERYKNKVLVEGGEWDKYDQEGWVRRRGVGSRRSNERNGVRLTSDSILDFQPPSSFQMAASNTTWERTTQLSPAQIAEL